MLAIRQSREWSARHARERVDKRLRRDWDARRDRLGFSSSSSSSSSSSIPARASMSTATGGMGGGGDAAVVASCVPLLSDGELSYGGGDDVVVVVPSPQISPPGAREIVESHLAAIDGHQRHRSSATTMITSTTANASAASLSSDALALPNSLEEATGDEDAAVVAVGSHTPPARSSTVTLPVPDLIKLF